MWGEMWNKGFRLGLRMCNTSGFDRQQSVTEVCDWSSVGSCFFLCAARQDFFKRCAWWSRDSCHTTLIWPWAGVCVHVCMILIGNPEADVDDKAINIRVHARG